MAFMTQPFDLLAEPLTRVKLLTLGGEEHIVLFSMHHAVIDGWSFDLLQSDLAAAYAAVVAGRQPSWAPLPVQVLLYEPRCAPSAM